MISTLLCNTYEIAKAQCYIYEIDATLDNIRLLSNDRKEVVGRPTLYSVVDVYSDMIVGFNLSFEPAQFKTVSDAFYVYMTDKVIFCAKYGLSISTSWWPARGVPAAITVDNAELTGKQIEHIIRSYGVQINFSSSYRGYEKVTVESSIHQLQHFVKLLIRGHGLLAKAGDRDSLGDAVLTNELC